MEEKRNRKSNRKKYIIILLILLLIILFVYLFFIKNPDKEKDTEISTDTQQEDTTTDDDLTPEDVLEQLEGATYVGNDVQMSIISPKEESFSMSQARQWEAQLDGIETDKGLAVECHWEFYLNEYDEEVLYEEMENRSGVSKEDPTLCGFTSTLIDSRGKLRVKLTANIKNSSGDILDTFVAEKRYTVL